MSRKKNSKNDLVFRPVGDVDIKIDFDEIPEYQRGELARFALEVTRNCFAIPGEEERYQAWLAERKKRLACGSA